MRRLLVTLTLLVAPVFAQAQTAIPTDAANQQADGMNATGSELYRAKRYLEAEDMFRRASALKHSYDIVGNLGIAEAALERWQEAAGHLAYALATFPANGKPELAAMAKEKLALARQHVGSFRVRCDTEGAEIVVDGKVVGVAPSKGEIFADPGPHVAECKLAGRSGGRVDVMVSAGTTPESAPIVALPSPELGGGGGGGGGAGSGTRMALAVTSGVLALGGIVAGAALTAAANGKSSDAAQLGASFGPSSCAHASTTSCQAIASDVSSQATLARGAVAGYVLGGVFAASTIGLVVWARGSSSTVQVGWTGTGLRVGGAW